MKRFKKRLKTREIGATLLKIDQGIKMLRMRQEKW